MVRERSNMNMGMFQVVLSRCICLFKGRRPRRGREKVANVRKVGQNEKASSGGGREVKSLGMGTVSRQQDAYVTPEVDGAHCRTFRLVFLVSHGDNCYSLCDLTDNIQRMVFMISRKKLSCLVVLGVEPTACACQARTLPLTYTPRRGMWIDECVRWILFSFITELHHRSFYMVNYFCSGRDYIFRWEIHFKVIYEG